MSKYTYSFSTDFNSQLDLGELQTEIKDSVNITPTISRIDRLGDVVDVWFNSALSAGEQTALDTLISLYSHIEVVQYKNVLQAYLKSNTFSGNSYTRAGIIVYEGSGKFPTINKIIAVGYMDVGITNFSIKIYDKTHALTIAETSFTDITESLLDLGSLSNIPTEESIIEVHVVKNGGAGNKNVFIESVSFYCA